jgi:hypothetical protein
MPFLKSKVHFLSFPRRRESRKPAKKNVRHIQDKWRKSSSHLLEAALGHTQGGIRAFGAGPGEIITSFEFRLV